MDKGTLYAFKDVCSGQMLVGAYVGQGGKYHNFYIFQNAQPIKHLKQVDLPSVEKGIAQPPFGAQGGCV